MIETFTLSNGLRVIAERMANLQSVSIGVWVKAGSMLELPIENGLSHLMEHMAFKGTKTRSARELAEQMDAIGGHMNAATSKVFTSYYAKVCYSDLENAVEILADIVLNPVIDEAELEKEKNVIAEEIAMVEDYPEDNAYDLLQQALYGEHSLAMTITGSKEQVKAYNQSNVRDFRQKYYNASNAVISVAGRFKKEELQSMLEHHFARWASGEEAGYPFNQANEPPHQLFKEKKSEQTHIGIAYRGLEQNDKRKHDMMIFNTIFGGGVSSRLFQSIREEKGLVYSIYSTPASYPGCGDFSIYAAASPGSSAKVIDEIHHQADEILKHGITEKELLQAKAQLRTGYVLALESAYARMSSLGHMYLLNGEITKPAQILKRIQKVSVESVFSLAQEILSQSPSIAIVGKGAGKNIKKFL